MSRRRRAALTGGILLFAGVAAAAVAIQRGGDDSGESERPYVPGERAKGIEDSLARKSSEQVPTVRFEDVAAQAGIEFTHFRGDRSVQLPEDMGSGVAWGDYDGDGDDDLYVVAISGPLPDREDWPKSPIHGRLFRNDGGRFTDVTEATGTAFHGLGMAASWADFDGDGDVDLMVTGLDQIALYENPGVDPKDPGAAWVDVAERAGLAQPGFHSGTAWADYDGDGDLDLYLGRYVKYDGDQRKAAPKRRVEVPFTLNPSSYDPAANALYRNSGDGTFVDVAEETGVANAAGRTLQVIWSDLDGDGRPDLYVANDVSDNALYRNLGDGKLKDVSHQALVADYRGAMGLAVADTEGDGALDLFVTHWIAQENALYAGLGGGGGGGAGAGGAGPALRFMDVADRMGLGQVALDYIGWGAAFLDYDQDGWSDLAITNGSTFQVKGVEPKVLIPMRPLLFWNKGGIEGFFEAGKDGGAGPFWTTPRGGRGLAVADYDRDGDPDLAAVAHAGGAQLLRNAGTDNHWSAVRLDGPQPVGARITLRAAGMKDQVREVRAGSSYLSQHSLEQLFGLGKHAGAISLEVRWPDGAVDSHMGLPADRHIRLTKGVKAATVVGDKRAFFDAFGPAQKAAAAARWTEAIPLLRNALRINPHHESALNLLAAGLAAHRNYGRAEAAWLTLLARHEDSPKGHAGLAALYSCQAEGAPFSPPDARRHLEAVIAINPEQTGPFTRLAEVLLASTPPQTDKARQILEKIVAANPMDPDAHHMLAWLEFQAGPESHARAVTLLATAATAARGRAASKKGASEEGDTEISDRSRRRGLAACRPYAAARAGLAKRYAKAPPTADDLAREFKGL